MFDIKSVVPLLYMYIHLIFFLVILDKAFLSLASDIAEPTILNTTNTSLTIRLPPTRTKLTCYGLTSPTPTYFVYYKEVNSTEKSSKLKYKMLVRLGLVVLCLFKYTFQRYLYLI